mmetsp:Transcript_33631/g.72907  ORF Transcript_33631/g.72907 Transcript_33631/m.72907 type:complete len:394 (-) Transcript_33631:301-1482(-)
MSLEGLRSRFQRACRNFSRKQWSEEFVHRWASGQRALTRPAFVGALGSMGISRSAADSFFDPLDLNKDGLVDASELYAFVCAGSTMPETARPPRSSAGYPAPIPGQVTSPSSRNSRSLPPQRSSSRHSSRTAPSQAGEPAQVDFSKIIVGEFKKLILKRGGSHGIHSLGRTFQLLDTNRNNVISSNEMEIGLNRLGLHMAKKDIDVLMRAIDKNGGKVVTFDEFMVAVRGDVNDRRLKLIKKAFMALDRDGSGIVDMKDILASFDVKHHPDVLQGNLKEDKALEHFLSQFDGIDKDGSVTFKEFVEYYKNISASIDDDDYFELMIRNAWHMSGGQGWCENTANKRILVTFNNGKQQVIGLESDLGLDIKDRSAVMKLLQKQGLENVRTFKATG